MVSGSSSSSSIDHKEVASGTNGYSTLASMSTVLSTLPKELPLDFLRTITADFSEQRIVAVGSFGTTYKGIMPDGQTIVVKKLAENAPIPREKAFTNEVLNSMTLMHENIVKMVGYCHEGQKKVVLNNGQYIMADVFESLICYEYLPMGNLYDNLFGKTSVDVDWSTRFKIIKGIVDGLKCIHMIPIIHMDLKPGNIWLDDSMVAKIANFGLSRLFGQEQTRANTENIVGSFGYMAPEYIYRGEISTQTDIYSLGVLILEITTGEENPREKEPAARGYIEKIRNAWTDEYIASKYSKLFAEYLQQVKLCVIIGLECVQIDWKKRPSTGNIADRLNARNVIEN